MEITAKYIRQIDEKSGVNGQGTAWRKKVHLFDQGGQFSKKLQVDFFNSNSDFTFTPGNEYTLKLDIESKEYQGKFYTNINCWGFVQATGNPIPDKQQPVSPQLQEGKQFETPRDARNAAVNGTQGPEPDDLPFVWAIPLIPFAGALASASLFC